jgi:putative acetyltransferase
VHIHKVGGLGFRGIASPFVVGYVDVGYGSEGAAVRNMYELSPPDKVFAFNASKLQAPDIFFWTAWEDELLLGCAALKELSATQGEIKSMRTPNSRRRAGAGRALLNHILDVARSRAYRVLYLETSRHPAFLPAQALYRSVGLKLCGPFGSYRENGNSVFMELPLPQL